MITLINRIGGQLVCDLNSGETLRLNNKESATIKDSEITGYLECLIQKGLVVSNVVKEPKTQKKSKNTTIKEVKNNVKL